MSAQPWSDDDEVDFVAPDPVQVEDLDAVEVMWMERNAKKYTPTLSRPFRAVRCTGITRNGPRTGKRCGREATLGTTVCEVHGAQLPVVKKAADQRKSEMILRMVGYSDDAVENLKRLMESASSEAVQLKAATEILDRAGIKGGTDINLTIEQVNTAAEQVQDRLATLKRRYIEGEVLESAQVPEYDDEEPDTGVTVEPVDTHNPAEEN